MEQVALIYLITGGVLVFGLMFFLLIIAGKYIYFSIKRRIIPKGCDIFIVNSNKHIDWHYKVPVDGMFKVKGKMYITNPDKVLSLKEDRLDNNMKEIYQKTKEGVKKGKERIEKRITEMKKKYDELEVQIKALKETKKESTALNQLIALQQDIKKRIMILVERLEQSEQIYYHNRRGAFIYIEDDPVPKDMFEWYTEMDSIMIDNVIARSQTKDPKAVKDMEKQLKWIKLFAMGAMIAAAVAAIICLKLQTDLTTIAQNIGVTLTL